MAKRRITQETFDAAVRENMEEFDMDPDEALREAVEQFESQGKSKKRIVSSNSLIYSLLIAYCELEYYLLYGRPASYDKTGERIRMTKLKNIKC